VPPAACSAAGNRSGVLADAFPYMASLKRMCSPPFSLPHVCGTYTSSPNMGLARAREARQAEAARPKRLNYTGGTYLHA
jgi:hypothetical protein